MPPSELPEKLFFFDIETDSKFAPYANLKMIGYQYGLDSKACILDLENPVEVQSFKDHLADPSYTKIHFNGINYDEMVLRRHGFPVCTNRHDVFLMAKTINPMLPAYGLKFLNWYYFGDWHEPERQVKGWCQINKKHLWEAPTEMLERYCLYDVTQTARLFKFLWPYIIKPVHWKPYTEVELPFASVLHEMILDGGDCINIKLIRRKIIELEAKKKILEEEASKITGIKGFNPNSSKQLSHWFTEFEGFELEVSDNGNLICRKENIIELLDLENPKNDKCRIARIAFDVRNITKQLGYLRAFRRAGLWELRTSNNRRIYRERNYVKIPKSYSLSGARTRRFLSSSRWGINFQNQDQYSKEVELIPPGWIGCSIDETQIENVVHMWATKDYERIQSYSADPDWSEYVWLCNRILGGSRSKKELDSIPSQANPSWSVYKQYKTCKLALNFGMGIAKFSESNRIDISRAKRIFAAIHRACPAIRELQQLVQNELQTKGYVQDPFGHIYKGPPDLAYKVVAYLVQGCGTGSIPKVMGRAIYDTIHSMLPEGSALMTGTIHDETAFRIRVDGCTDDEILACLRRCLYCCEQQYSSLFDNIPLRAKLYLSVTSVADAEEINHYKLTPSQFDGRVQEYISKARSLNSSNRN